MTRPWLAIGFATIAALCLGGSVLSHRWLVSEYASEDGFSPRSFQGCVYEHNTVGDCHLGANADVMEAITTSSGSGAPPPSPLFVPTGALAFFAAAVAAAALLAAAGFAAAGQRVRLPVSLTTIATLAIVVGGFSAVMFLGSRPGMSPAAGGPFQTGGAAFVYGIAAIVGLVAARRLARVFKQEPVADRAKSDPKRKPRPRRR